MKMKITKNFKNIHNSEADLKTMQNTLDKIVCGNIQLLEVVHFGLSILDPTGILDPPL